ncbi:MAG: hypothetical protein PHT98_02935 [Kiritimatiellae bacterium]|nr:hypothetical protein [Kiritimatiellia bacterium]
MKRMKACMVGTVVLCAALLGVLSPGASLAGVYDDAAAWWHFDYDPNHDPQAVNVAAADEIRDQRDWGTAAVKGASGRHASGVRGVLGGPLWTNAPVVCPAGGRRYGGLSLRFQQETNALGQVWPDAVKIDNFRLNDSSAIVTRFRWDGITFSSGYPGWIYNNSLDWGNRRGWMFGVRYDGGLNRLGMYVGQTAFYLGSSSNIITGKWYDAAAVITDNGTEGPDTVELFLWPEGGTLQYQKFTTTVVTNLVGGSGTVIGSESFQDGYSSPTNSNSGKSFKGLVNHLAVWDRALTYAEVLEAFCYPQPLVQIGLHNGSATDLRIESEADPVFAPGDPWHTVPRALGVMHPDLTLKVPLTAAQANLNTVFHIRTLDTAAAGQKVQLRFVVNAATNPPVRIGANQDFFWPIPKSQLASGTNTFTLSYAGGPAAWIALDWMELGGAWQVGIDNNSATDFIVESQAGDHFYITDPDWKHLERAVVQGSDSNTVLHFVLSPEMIQNVTFSYSTRIVQQGCNAGTQPTPPFPFSIGVNGRILYQSTTGLPDNTLLNLPFAPGDLRAGENDINLMFNSTNGWLQFDFHRLDTQSWTLPWPAGSLFYLR